MSDKEIAAFEGFWFKLGDLVAHVCCKPTELAGVVIERGLVETPSGIQRHYVVSVPKGENILYHEIELQLHVRPIRL